MTLHQSLSMHASGGAMDHFQLGGIPSLHAPAFMVESDVLSALQPAFPS